MDTIKSLDKFRVPIGNQAIELQEFVFEAGGMPLLRTRIREGSRFTIFDVDPVTAARTVNVNALKMVAGLRSLTCNQCPVPVAPATVSAPAATVVAEPAVQTVVVEAAPAEANPAPAGEAKAEAETPVAPAATSGETK